jgi:hypothetical protein
VSDIKRFTMGVMMTYVRKGAAIDPIVGTQTFHFSLPLWS